MSNARSIVTGGLFVLACAPLVHAAAAEASGEDESAGAPPEGILTDRNGDGC